MVLDDSQFVLQFSLLRAKISNFPILVRDLLNFQFKSVFISID